MAQSATGDTTQAVVTLVNILTQNWEKILYTFLIVIVALALIRVLGTVLDRFGKEKGLAPGTVGFLNAVIKYGVLLFAAINVLGVFSFTYIYSLILSLGLISVVIALGSQTIISNLIGGVIVYLERPFAVGDVIRVGENTGEVTGITFRATALRGLNGLDIAMPNSTFITLPIVNYTRTQSYLLKVPFVLPRTANISNLLSTIKGRVTALPGILGDRDMHVFKSRITPDSIDYEFHLWVKDPRDSETATSAVIDAINEFQERSLKTTG